MRGSLIFPDSHPDARRAPDIPESTLRPDAPAFLPFGAEAFAAASRRHVPVFLVIGDALPSLSERSLREQIAQRTVPVHLFPGERPDVELLCLRASALFSEESSLPLCALLMPNGCPFLAAPLPPAGYPLDEQRLFVWLAHADRRFCQNQPAFSAQAAQVARTLHADALVRPYSPQDAAHDVSRALYAAEDRQRGGFGGVKAPHVPALRFLLHRSARGDSGAHAALSRALDAMLTSPVCDPVDGGFFRAALTEDWRAFVPQKPLGVNALLALTLLESGRRSEAVRTLDFLQEAFALDGGLLAPCIGAPVSAYAFTAQQVCAVLGSEEGLRACRLLGLLRSQAGRAPQVVPSRFSPLPDEPAGRLAQDDAPPLCPALVPGLTPEDAAFLRRALPILCRARASRSRQTPVPYVLTGDCAIAAWVFAVCGRRLGEPRYTHTAQRAVSALLRRCPPSDGHAPLPPGCIGGRSPSRPMCGAACALALALLSLGQTGGLESYAQSGLHLLSGALHAFTREDGALLHTPKDPAAIFPRVPAIADGELPAPAAMLVTALRLADALAPQARYMDAALAIWDFAAPHVKKAPLAHAALVDAMLG